MNCIIFKQEIRDLLWQIGISSYVWLISCGYLGIIVLQNSLSQATHQLAGNTVKYICLSVSASSKPDCTEVCQESRFLYQCKTINTRTLVLVFRLMLPVCVLLYSWNSILSISIPVLFSIHCFPSLCVSKNYDVVKKLSEGISHKKGTPVGKNPTSVRAYFYNVKIIKIVWLFPGYY